jgi:flagella basal body P-ring formation protein FlgA
MIKKITTIICLLLIAGGVFAVENPEKEITAVIEEYVLEKHPEWIGYDIDVTYKYADKIFDSLRAVDGGVNFKIAEVYTELKPVGNVIFPIIISSGKKNRKIFLRTKVRVYKDVIVSKNYIPRGEIIKAEDLELKKRDIAMIPDGYFDDAVSLKNNEAKTSIPENSTVYSWMVKKIPVVHRGDTVTIKVVADNLIVKTEGTVLEDGYIGKKLKVKRKDSKKSLEGVLVADSVVEVRLR